ncbi:MAG TPA: hypothetical protein VGI08_05125 [Diaminobutyricibacter sp.]
MTSRYPWVARAFGDNAVTIWSWLLTLPFAVTVMAGYEFLRIGQPAPLAFVVALLVHVLLGVVLLGARLSILRPGSGRHRPLTALLLFAAIGVVRPFLALSLATSFGILVAPGDLLSRVTINVVSSVVMLTLIAVVVDILREHGGIQRRLIAARAAVEERRADADRGVDALSAEFTTTIAQRIDTAIGTVARGLAPEDAAQLLRRISDEVVRPMSHELFRDAESRDAEDESVADPGRPIGFLESLRRVASGLRPDPPIVITLVYLVLVFPHYLTTYGPAVAVIQTPVIAGIYLAGNTATFAIGSRLPTAGWRTIAIVACYTAVALIAAMQNSAALAVFGYSPEFYWAEVVSYPFVAIVIAVTRSVSVQLHNDEDALARSLRERVRLASRAHRRLAEVRRRLSHVLHATVQGELIAASLGLRGQAAASHEAMDAASVVTKTVSGIKRELLSLSGPPSPAARDAIGGIVAMWSTAVRIDTDVAEDAWRLLDDDPARASAVVDALSEGLTNAVRHGHGERVALTIRHDPRTEGVVVEIRSEGTIADPRNVASGIGLERLRTVASGVSLHADDEQVVLTVVVS